MPDGIELERLRDRATALVEAARRAGADEADAVVASSRGLGIRVREGAIEKNERSESDQIGLRVFAGRRQAIVSTSNPDPTTYAGLAERAVAMARAAPEDPYAGLGPADLLARDPAFVDIADPTEVSVATLERLSREAEDAALAVEGVTKSSGAGAGQTHAGVVLVTSAGFSGAYLRSDFGVSASAIAGTGTGMQVAYDVSHRVHFDDLETPEKIGRTAGERAVAMLNPRKLATERLPVIVDERVAGSIVGHFTGAVNGQSIARRTSFLRERMGSRVFAKGVRITDDPLRPRGLRSRPFDDEGVVSRRLVLVDDGVLSSWVLDASSARELGLVTTGHASRGASSPPSPSISNVTLEPGTRSPADMMRDLKRGLLVTGFIGHGPSLVTGDYSRGANGFLFEDGAIVCPVAEITVAGHLAEMFAALEPADDIRFDHAVATPSVFIGEMTVAGR